jgi:2-phosphosulfolactate phosphatase
MPEDESEFDIRCEWGQAGVETLAPISDVVIIVDVLSFSTSVDIAVGRGAVVYPYGWPDAGAAAFAESIGAELALPERRKDKYGLAPSSLINIPAGTRLVMPSANGAALAMTPISGPVLAGCLRNARAVANAAHARGRRIAIIPAGEMRKDGDGRRPAFEDLVGAGAIAANLPGEPSPQARGAASAFRQASGSLNRWLRECESGTELIERGFPEDVELAAQLDVSGCVPELIGRAFVDGSTD